MCIYEGRFQQGKRANARRCNVITATRVKVNIIVKNKYSDKRYQAITGKHPFY